MHTYILLERIESNIRILYIRPVQLSCAYTYTSADSVEFFFCFLHRTAIRCALFDFCVIDRTQFSPNLYNSVLCAYKIEKNISKLLGPTEMHRSFYVTTMEEKCAHERRKQYRSRKLIARCFLMVHNFIIHKWVIWQQVYILYIYIRISKRTSSYRKWTIRAPTIYMPNSMIDSGKNVHAIRSVRMLGMDRERYDIALKSIVSCSLTTGSRTLTTIRTFHSMLLEYCCFSIQFLFIEVQSAITKINDNNNIWSIASIRFINCTSVARTVNHPQADRTEWTAMQISHSTYRIRVAQFHSIEFCVCFIYSFVRSIAYLL